MTSTSARPTGLTTAGTAGPGPRAKGTIQAGGRTADVAFEDADPAVVEALHGAYHAKYDRYGERIVNTVDLGRGGRGHAPARAPLGR